MLDKRSLKYMGLLMLMFALVPAVFAQQQPDNQDKSSNEQWLNGSRQAAAASETVTADNGGLSAVSPELLRTDAKSLSLGFVNFRRVMASIPQLANLRARLDSEFEQQKMLLDQQTDEIQKLEDKLAGMPRGDEYSILEKEVIAKRRTLARLDASFRDAYSVRRNEELATLQQLVVDEIVALAKDEGYDVILNDTGVIYVSSNADLTQEVIDRLQRLSLAGAQGVAQ